MQLREWQDSFQQQILQAQQCDEVLIANLLEGAISAQAQLQIYSNAYVIRLVEALRSNYPALHQLLGDTDFDSMGRAYLRLNPPTRASIRWFGHALEGFLQREKPYAGLPILSELARFEWALRHTVDAADAERLTVENLQAIAPESWGELQFILHPSVSVMVLHWNTPPLWQALSAEQQPPEPAKQTMNWIVYRQADLVAAWRSVSDLELAAIECISRGESFSNICEAVSLLVSDSSESALTSAQLLRSWVEQGLISIRHEQLA
ncbi:Uncharacterised protein [Halioglobus japonicus]|nr:Uncharacterised protein [Halioglobus japonicus]